jgi:hypothetical protein
VPFALLMSFPLLFSLSSMPLWFNSL